MKRYDCYYTNDFADDYPAFSRETVDGDWVSFEDAQAEVAAANAEVRRVESELMKDNANLLKIINNLRDELTAANLERDALKKATSSTESIARISKNNLACRIQKHLDDHEDLGPFTTMDFMLLREAVIALRAHETESQS